MFSISAIGALFGRMPAAVKIGLVGLLLAGGIRVRDDIKIHRLNGQIEKADKALSDEKAAKAAIAAQLADVTSNRDALVRQLAEQNSAIDALRLQKRQAESAAALTAVRVLRQGEADSRALRSEPTRVTPGHEGMNAWIKSTFTSSR